MPNSKSPTPTPTVSSAKAERQQRLSIAENETKASSAKVERKLRMSLNEIETSQRSTTAKRKPKVSITPSIPESGNEMTDKNPIFVMETETRATSKISRQASTTSKASGVGSSKSPRTTLTYDNGAYEGNLKSDSRPPSKTPSVQSLEIYREQYCCCAKRTKCERYLFVAVAVLGVIIVVLVIVIAILAKNGNFDNNKLFSFHL